MALDEATAQATAQADSEMLSMLSGKSTPEQPDAGSGGAPASGSGTEPDEISDDLPGDDADIEDSAEGADAADAPESDAAQELADYAEELGFDGEAVKRRIALLGEDAVRKALDAEREALVSKLRGGDKKEEPSAEAPKAQDLSKYLDALGDEDRRMAFIDNNPDAEWLLEGIAALKAEVEALKKDTGEVKGVAQQFTQQQRAAAMAEVNDFYERVWKSGDRRFGPANAMKLSPQTQQQREEVATYAEFLMQTRGLSPGKALDRSYAKFSKQSAEAPKVGGERLPTALRSTPQRGQAVIKERKAADQQRQEKQNDRVMLDAISKVFR